MREEKRFLFSIPTPPPPPPQQLSEKTKTSKPQKFLQRKYFDSLPSRPKTEYLKPKKLLKNTKVRDPDAHSEKLEKDKTKQHPKL
jgi:hypothetical protein